MRELILIGDTHGMTTELVGLINQRLHNQAAMTIVQLGDFGLWTHERGGSAFLDRVNEALAKQGKTLYALGGNHENWDHWNWMVANLAKSNKGFAVLRSNIRLAPRVHSWSWGGKRMQIVGGAVSVDREPRQKEMRQGRPASWWPAEQITDAEVDSIPWSKVDYLFTHDCASSTPFKHNLVPDPESQIHRQRIDEVLRRTNPELHFHGHMHDGYKWQNMVKGLDGNAHYVQTYGLADQWDARFHWGVLDLEDNQFTFRRR